jgi:hypothetical protein
VIALRLADAAQEPQATRTYLDFKVTHDGTRAAGHQTESSSNYDKIVQLRLLKIDLQNPILICEISSSHGGEHDVQSCLLGYTAVF